MKLVVVGGVAGGMSAAARARRLDENAEIVVLERSAHVSFANCGLPYHIGGTIRNREKLLLQTPERLKAMLKLDVRIRHEVAGMDLKKRTVLVRDLDEGSEYLEEYDKLVLSPGAAPIVPPLPGIDHEKIFTLRNVEDMDRILGAINDSTTNAVVIGGGYIGIEMAENLLHRNIGVAVVEMLDQIMPPMDREMVRDLEEHLRWHGARLFLGTAAAAFGDENGQVRVELKDGNRIFGDFVILSVGVRPDTHLAVDGGLSVGERGGIQVNEYLQTSDPHVYAVGDAIEVTDRVTGLPSQIPLAGPANRQGRMAADNIFGRQRKYESTQGTAIVKVLSMTAGLTGANEKTLKQLGRPYEKVYIHPSGHAGYYPDTAPMHMKVLFRPGDGKLLGGQVVGFDGIDKRIDVLATALRGGLSIYDLQDLELAYAPPYGSAKDPVNMAGFVGANLLQGDIELWYAEDYPVETDQGIVVDVRSTHEYDPWHIPGSVNIPIGTLRERLGELPKDKTIYVYCKVGFRSYLAYRIVKQSGFENVRTLAGGSMTFCSYHGSGPCAGPPEAPIVSYAEEKSNDPPAPTGSTVEVDCCGLQCPGPIRKLSETIDALKPGDEVHVRATDPGFLTDVPAWCKSRGHEVVDIHQVGSQIEAKVRRGTGRKVQSGSQGVPQIMKKTMVVFSGDLDKVLASFIIANGAATMGNEVTMFFTFWGLNALRKAGPQAPGKGLLDRMFGWMMPKGPSKLKLSQMHMGGMGTAMMKHVMAQKNVDSLSCLLEHAQKAGVKLVACSMSMEVMGIQMDELIDGVEMGGVAAFLGESDDANMTLFI